MGTYLRRTPAMLEVLRCLVKAGGEVWGLQLSLQCGRPTGTVYPILERLEREGFVQSRWETDDARPGPRRRLYDLTDVGREWAETQIERGRRRHGDSSQRESVVRSYMTLGVAPA